MINNNTDDFGCLQNTLFIVSCPHYFENIPKLRTNLFLTARCFMELTKSCYSYYSNHYVYYVKRRLSNIVLNPEENVHFKNYLCILLLTPSNTRPRLMRAPTCQCPHKCTLLRRLLCIFPSKPIARLCHQPEVSAAIFWVALSNGIS